MHRVRRAALVGSLAAAALLAACSSSGGSGPTVTSVAKASGDAQVGPAATALATPLAVLVTDQGGAPVAGVTVSWSVASGGGSLNPASVVTGADGKAATSWTLGPAAGTQTVSAAVSGATGSPVSFSAVAQIQGATQIALSAGNGQSDTVLATLGQPVAVVVKDQNNAPVAGVVVTFAGAGLSGLKTADTTDAGGIASIPVTFDSVAGPRTVTATVTGLIGSPVSFSVTATAGNAASVALAGGDHQVGPVSAALPLPHTVLVKDAHGNVKSGVTVTWNVGTGGGSLSTTAPVTNAAGIASVTKTLGASVGVSVDTATLAGAAGSPVAFADTAAPGTTVTVSSDMFTPQHDTIAAGTFVTFTWASGTHTVNWDTAPADLPPNSGTKSSGTFAVRLTAVGSYSYHCIFHGTPGAGMYGTIEVQ